MVCQKINVLTIPCNIRWETVWKQTPSLKVSVLQSYLVPCIHVKWFLVSAVIEDQNSSPNQAQLINCQVRFDFKLSDDEGPSKLSTEWEFGKDFYNMMQCKKTINAKHILCILIQKLFTWFTLENDNTKVTWLPLLLFTAHFLCHRLLLSKVTACSSSL